MTEEKPIPAVELPTLDEIEEYTPVVTPMDKKTIVNAITKRIPEVRKIDLVDKDKPNHRYQLVIVCQLVHEVAIIVEDDFNMMMRHKDLMNLVDRIYEEIKSRKTGKKNNKLPADFLSNPEKYTSLRPFA
ncbi:MAG: hypothetical protein KGL39_24310 [Patescibacteria group bacterium]|nr:hypothetical protein [Patescibacteria group bacterium]